MDKMRTCPTIHTRPRKNISFVAEPPPTYDPLALSRTISVKFWMIVVGILLLLVLMYA